MKDEQDRQMIAYREQDHAAAVVELRRRNRSFLVQCPTCGLVGQAQDYRGDAQAIADRHHEVCGFEREQGGS